MVGETFDSGQVFTEAVDDFTALFYSDRVFIGAREYPIGQCVVDILNLEESELFRIDQILMEFFHTVQEVWEQDTEKSVLRAQKKLQDVWNLVSVLPVYRNGSYDSAGKPVGLSQTDMKQRLEAAVAALDLDSYDIEIEQECLTANTDGLQICVYADGMIEVWFENGRTLPEEYSFTLFDTTDAEAEQVLEYLSQEYSELIGVSEPKKVLSGSYMMWNDYDEAGNYITEPRFEREYALYDSSGDELEDILNYNFNCVRFYPDDNGNLSLIRIHSGLSCAEKMGDYPIISTDEAYELLLKGHYITSVPYTITDTELICKVELVYRNGSTEKTFLPYYRFYIELPEMRRENGLTDYGAYYVPAIQEEYIRNMPLWDGSIN